MVTFRTETTLTNRKLEGYAAVFDQRTNIGFWQEEFAAESFDEVLASADLDVRALFNHNPDHLLGRNTSGTLRVSADDHGLEYSLDLPTTTMGNDVHIMAERGDLTGASMAFIPGDMEILDGGEVERHTRVAGLFDISPVTYPAYAGTETFARSMGFDSTNRRARAIAIRHRHKMRKQ